MFIDTHTHLFVDAFDEDRTAVVQRAIESGVERMLLPNIDVDTVNSMNKMVENFPDNCFSMVGLHPSSVKEDWQEKLNILRKELETEKHIAVGEIGMDLYWDKTYLEEQKMAFRTQIEWAKEFQIPIVIHARKAFEPIFEILDELNDDSLTGVFHCFTGSIEQAKKVQTYGGFKLGMGGVITYKKSTFDNVLKTINLSDIILETDAPYLTPVPFRGKRNESSYVVYVAEKLADVYEVKLSEIETQTTQNALDLFKKLPR